MLIEAPRQMSGPLNQLMHGAAEVVGSFQDSELGKRASAGLQIAMDNADEMVEKREQQGKKSAGPPNLLGFVGPVMQAVFGANDSTSTESKDKGKSKGKGKGKGGERQASRRRIQINASEQQRTLRPSSMRTYEENMAESDREASGDAMVPEVTSGRSRSVAVKRRPVVVRKAATSTRTDSNGITSHADDHDDDPETV
jgi:hypothetical protein